MDSTDKGHSALDMTKNQRSLFEREFSDVQSLAKTPRATRQKHNEKQAAKRVKARQNAISESSGLGLQDAQPVDLQFVEPYDHLEWKSMGVQPETLNKLKHGRYPIQEKLDLHNVRIVEAYRRVREFFAKCLEQRLRTVAIVHGLGLRSTPPAQMKSHVAHWLKQHPSVNAYVSAPGHRGGAGVTFVHLKKSRDAKLDTKERIARRLG